MRGSGVAQSLKSLASKLHPQLPLSPKESQRLLTALTSSFRQKLDEAHPRQAHDEHAGSREATGNHALHTSSVAFADRHLASVLTNPLLTKSDGATKPALNLESAKRELEQNPGRDPISVLEEYHQKGAATLLIADLCLRTFRESLSQLSVEDRRTKVESSQAGKRTLEWLWTSGLYETDEFVDDRRLMTVLINMISEEGRERYLWSWLRLDMKLGKDPNPVRRIFHSPFRWKDFVVRNLMLLKYDGSSPESLNETLDVYLSAVDLLREIAPHSTAEPLPLSGAARAIINRIFYNRGAKQQWDVTRYDRFIETLDLVGIDRYWTKFQKAQLMLSHPRDASPLPMIESLKASSLAEATSKEAKIWKQFELKVKRTEVRQKVRLTRYKILAETAVQLQGLGYVGDLEWIVPRIRALFPEYARYIDDESSIGSCLPRKTVRASRENFSQDRPGIAPFTEVGPV